MLQLSNTLNPHILKTSMEKHDTSGIRTVATGLRIIPDKAATANETITADIVFNAIISKTN